MSQPEPDRPSQDQDNLIRNTTVSGDLTFAPVQIGTKIETLIIESSPEQVTRRVLNSRSPYQGLKRFNFADRDRFFGRDRLIATLLAAVNQNSLNLVLGASGSGKSSVVRAGLIPELNLPISLGLNRRKADLQVILFHLGSRWLQGCQGLGQN